MNKNYCKLFLQRGYFLSLIPPFDVFTDEKKDTYKRKVKTLR